MRCAIKIIIVMVLLVAVPLLSYCQYFQRLFDIDSSYDWGWNISVRLDGLYFIEGGFTNHVTGGWAEFAVTVSADGGAVLEQHLFYTPQVSYYQGLQGEMKAKPGGYFMPLSKQVWHDTTGRGWAGMAIYSSGGDSIAFLTYTDTSLYFDLTVASAIIPDKGYLLGGARARIASTAVYPSLLIRTDTTGDTLWTRTYQKFPDQSTEIRGIVPLADGRMAVAASCMRIEDAGPPGHYGYYSFAPWYMLLDSAGNIIRDTVYNSGIQDGGWLRSDMNGGYFTIGSYDSLYSNDPTADENFPSFIAHLDTNFRTTWITSFPYSTDTGHREKWLAKQLHDGSYIILGDRWSSHPGSYGWAAKVSKYGEVVWNNFYLSDSINDSYFRDVAEKPDGSLVFVGTSFNDSCPAYRHLQDLWIVGVDSNGCQNLFCKPVRVDQLLAPTVHQLSAYPNPTNGALTVTADEEGVMVVTDMTGRWLVTWPLKKGANSLQLPQALAAGIYIGKFTAENGKQNEIKIVYQP